MESACKCLSHHGDGSNGRPSNLRSLFSMRDVVVRVQRVGVTGGHVHAHA